MSPDSDDASPALSRRKCGEIVSLTLQVLGACLLLLALVLAARRVTHDLLYRCLITTVPIVCLQVIAYGKGWVASVPVLGSSRLRFLYLAGPFLIMAGNFCGHPISATTSREVWIAVVLVCMLVGFSEELMFRGFLFALLRDVSPTACLLVTSVIFGVFHFGQGMQGMMVAGIVGLSFGLARLAGMPLALLMTLHALIDLPTSLPQAAGLPTEKVVIHVLALKIHTQPRMVLIVFALAYSIFFAAVFMGRYHSVWQRVRGWMGDRFFGRENLMS